MKILLIFAFVAACSANPISRVYNEPGMNPDLFEGDILGIDPFNLKPGQQPRNALKDPQMLWPNGIVPFVVSAAFDQDQLDMIETAISEYHSKTCIRFVPRTNEEDFILIAPYGAVGGCSSFVGRIGGPQVISLDSSCFVIGIVLHELMHSIGFHHEQSRTDRDEYVDINWSNVQERVIFAFKNYNQDVIQDLGAPYDYGSVMHYGNYAFAFDPLVPTIYPRHEGVEIGQRRGFSEIDLYKINKLYQCNLPSK